nr:cytochrome P450 [Sphingomonas sp. Y57]
MIDSSTLAERPSHVPADRVVDFDVFSPPGVEKDFQDAWAALQVSGAPDIIWTPRYGGHWVPTRGRVIAAMFRDHERFSSRVPQVPKDQGELYEFIPQTLDPPRHRPYRNLLNDSFSPKAILRMEDRVRRLAIDLIEGFRAKGRCNFVRDYAEILPIHIFLSIVDLPIADAPYLLNLANQINRPDGSMTLEEALTNFRDYLGVWIDKRRGGEGRDLLTKLVNSEVEGRPLSRDEVLRMTNIVLLAGLDTVVNFLGFMMLFLARNPEHRRKLTRDPGLIPAAVDEFVRRFPVVLIGREVTRDMDYEGVTFKKGEMVMIPTMLHGLDDRENPGAPTVDYRREKSEHSTFGGGVHRCAGSFLARAEIRVTLEEWLSRIPEFHIEEGAEIRHNGGLVGGIQELPLVWDSPSGV